MTNTVEFNITELGAKFGSTLSQAYAEIITLEKMVNSLRAQIQGMTTNEGRLVEHIQDLEDDLGLLKSENLELREITEAQRIQIEATNDTNERIEEPASLARVALLNN